MLWLLIAFMSANGTSWLSPTKQPDQSQHNLTVTVTNVKTLKGKMVISVYNNPKEFPHYYKEYKLIKVAATSASVTATFSDLPEGEYAVAVYQDVNEDGLCNTNFVGYPTEGFGFSNNVRALFSEPTFNACRLRLDHDLSITISLVH